ncbi:hypothetical protein [Tellurirhabdus rosea]|uniref:hypothetical protein n=1 Tax=Tellurirhabdus rosea TaxID=2674997 RepID=UPI002255D71A|nr:hypothetical protein [Tellurirhabdus rosea]
MAAKAWFDKVGYGKNNRVTAGTKSKNKTPRWEKGESYELNGETVVELPLDYEAVQGARKNRDHSKPDAVYREDPYENITVLTKYVVVRDKNGNYRSLIMKVVASGIFFINKIRSMLLTKALSGRL